MVASLVLAGIVLTAAHARALGIDFASTAWQWWLPGEAVALSFRELDENTDGRLSALEAVDHPVIEGMFLEADLDGDGQLSPLEFNHAALELSQDEEAVASGTIGAVVVEHAGRVVVTRVGRDTPAARSGLRPGDVVLGFDGETIERSRQFYRRVLDTPPGSVVELAVERAGETKQLQMRVRPIDTTPRA